MMHTNEAATALRPPRPVDSHAVVLGELGLGKAAVLVRIEHAEVRGQGMLGQNLGLGQASHLSLQGAVSAPTH